MIYKVKKETEYLRIDLSRVIAAESSGYILSPVVDLKIYLDGGHLINIDSSEAPDFLKAWEEYDKARETTAILIPDLEDQEAPEVLPERYKSCEKCLAPYELTEDGLQALKLGESLSFPCKTCRGLIELPAKPKESFGGFRADCIGCKEQFLLNRSDEKFLSTGPKGEHAREIIYNCERCGKEQRLGRKDFK